MGVVDDPLLGFAAEQLAFEPVELLPGLAELLPEGIDFGFGRLKCTEKCFRIRGAGRGIFLLYNP